MEAPLPPTTWPNPAPVFLLLEFARVNGLIRVHAPVSLSDLSEIENRLGFYTKNPSNFIKEFQYITESYNLIFIGIYMISPTTLSLRSAGESGTRLGYMQTKLTK